jgi:CDP-glycerol glycerophosphotransferase
MRDSISARPPASSLTGNTPILSVIIPTYDVERYIGTCLDSITGQDFPDFEIIAVDGKSTDRTCELLGKRGVSEPRLTVIADERIGPGRARNVGARKATGEYIWFVDGDDEVAPGCLAAIADQLRVDRPDVLLINHQTLAGGVGETDADRTLERGQDDRLLAGADGRPFTLADRPWMMDVGLVSWNKIVRREFFQSVGAEFASSWPHEDVPVSCELLLSASRISAVSQICYYYRRHRAGSATTVGKPGRHFNVFDTWQPVLKLNKERMLAGSCQAHIYHRLFERSIWHCTTILDTAGYVTPAHRRAFFDAISRLYAEYLPDGYRRPGGFRGVKFRLVAMGSYRAYSALDPLNRLRVAVQRKLLRS